MPETATLSFSPATLDASPPRRAPQSHHRTLSPHPHRSSTVLTTESGRVFASGLNDFGQLGISDDLSYTMEPTLVPGIDKEIKHISTGYSHSCAITLDGGALHVGKEQ